MKLPHRNLLPAVLRKLGSLLPRRATRSPGARVLRPWRQDADRTYPVVGLTPSRLLALLQAADGGAPREQFELFSDMLQKWPRLAAVAATRRLALTGLDWEITPAAGGDDAPAALAQAASEHCRQTLAALPALRETLDHLAGATAFGIAVAELVWERGRLVDVVPAPPTRLLRDPHEPWRLRVLTPEQPARGVALDAQPWKWIIHEPGRLPGRHFQSGLLRASAALFLAQNLSFKDWLVASQIAGMPLRVAQFEPGTPDADKLQLLRMLEALGTDAVGVFSKSVDVRLIEPARGAGERAFAQLQDYCNTEVTILWLGQHLTTDLRGSGSRAAADVHDRVREDLLADDIASEAAALRRDLLTPLVRARFGPAAPIPHFRRALVQSVEGMPRVGCGLPAAVLARRRREG